MSSGARGRSVHRNFDGLSARRQTRDGHQRWTPMLLPWWRRRDFPKIGGFVQLTTLTQAAITGPFRGLIGKDGDAPSSAGPRG
jgi:hypothetical protein